MKECSQNLHGSVFRGLDYHSELYPKNAPRLSGCLDEKSDGGSGEIGLFGFIESIEVKGAFRCAAKVSRFEKIGKGNFVNVMGEEHMNRELAKTGTF